MVIHEQGHAARIKRKVQVHHRNGRLLGTYLNCREASEHYPITAASIRWRCEGLVSQPPRRFDARMKCQELIFTWVD